MAAPPYSAEREAVMAKTTFTEKMLMEEVIACSAMSTAAKEKAKIMLNHINERSDKRKTSEKAVSKKNADTETKAKLLSIMEKNKTYAANELTVLLNKSLTNEITVFKVNALAKALVTEGKVTQTDIRFNGKPAKGYTLV